MFNAYFFFFYRLFLKFTAVRSAQLGGTHKKLERKTHTLYLRLYSTVRRGGSRDNDAAGNTNTTV